MFGQIQILSHLANATFKINYSMQWNAGQVAQRQDSRPKDLLGNIKVTHRRCDEDIEDVNSTNFCLVCSYLDHSC